MGLATSLKIITTPLVRWRRNERGTAIVEYLLLVFLIAIVAMLAVGLFGWANHDKFMNIANSIT